MGNLKNPITTDEALMGKSTANVVQFNKEKRNNKITKKIAIIFDERRN